MIQWCNRVYTWRDKQSTIQYPNRDSSGTSIKGYYKYVSGMHLLLSVQVSIRFFCFYGASESKLIRYDSQKALFSWSRGPFSQWLLRRNCRPMISWCGTKRGTQQPWADFDNLLLQVQYCILVREEYSKKITINTTQLFSQQNRVW